MTGALTEAKARADRLLKRKAANRPNIFRGAFEEEVAYAEDASKFKVVFCTRRAAKTFSFGLEAINDSYTHPGANYLFLGLVREEAKRMFWKAVLKKLDHDFGLGIRFNESSLTATMPNGASIYIGAADANEDEMRKLLGLAYRKVRIDEAQDWRHTDLHELIYSVLKPACTDWNGTISISGTPGKLLKSYFRTLTPISVRAGMAGARGEDTAWSLHCWDTSKNTAIGPAGLRICDEWAREIAELIATHPGIEKTPSFRRNYLGEWVLDESDLVYAYNAKRNDFDGVLPLIDAAGRWHHVLGIDLGYNDATAYHLYTWHDADPNLYGLQTFKQSGMDVTAASRMAQAFDTKHNLEAMVIDGSNKQAVMEMSNRHNLGKLVPADKKGKSDFIELMNADFITGRIRLSPECESLKDEYGALVWDSEKLKRTGKREEHSSCENHAADAALYAWRYCYQFLHKEPVVQPARGTPAFEDALKKKMFQRTMREVQAKKMNQEYQVGDFGTFQQMDSWGTSDLDPETGWGG